MSFMQNDFAQPISPTETVPGTLRGFRWMKLDGRFGRVRLESVTLPYVWAAHEENVASCAMRKMKLDRVIDPGDCAVCAAKRVGQAFRHYAPVPRSYKETVRCQCYAWQTLGSPLGLSVATYSVAPIDEGPPHPSPNRECKCGFYASYRPISADDTPGVNLSVAEIIGARYVYVLAVVQAYGRVILGEVGFRAEKMRIEAVFASSLPEWDELRALGYGDRKSVV